MSNVIQFKQKKNENIRFVVRSVTVDLTSPNSKNEKIKKHAAIFLRNIELDRQVMHPITDFIFKNYKNQEYNTMANACHHIVPFLNWVFFDSSHKVKDLSELTINMYVDFLNVQIDKGNSHATVNRYGKYIYKLYIYLASKQILTNIDPNKLINMREDTKTALPHNKKKNADNIHELKTNLIIPFIELAFEKCNCIALGVYYQIFGGLRYNEVISLTKGSIKNVGSYGEFGQILNLETTYLRSNLSGGDGSGEVKKDRKQVVFPYRLLLKKMYKHHISSYNSVSEPLALFVDSKGNPMSAATYRYHFNKLKKSFIQQLKDDKDIRLNNYAIYLENSDWSTHIGRGIFSNLMAEYSDSVLEIAVSRGDSSYTSALTYQANTKRMLEKMTNEIDLMYTGDFLDT